jgi:hypothetical protein
MNTTAIPFMGEKALTRSERKSTPTTPEVVTKKGKDNRMGTAYSMTPEVEEELSLFVSDWKAELADVSGEEEEKRTEQTVKKQERSEVDGAEYWAASKRHQNEDVGDDDDVVYMRTNPCRRPDQPPPKAKRGLAASMSKTPEDQIIESMTILHIGFVSSSAIKVSSLLRKRSTPSVGEMLKPKPVCWTSLTTMTNKFPLP